MIARFAAALLVVTAALSTPLPARADEPKFELGKKEEVKDVEWKAAAQAGLILTSGNSSTLTFSAGATASRKAGNNKLSLELAAAYGKSDIRVAVDGNGDGKVGPGEIDTVDHRGPADHQPALRGRVGVTTPFVHRDRRIADAGHRDRVEFRFRSPATGEQPCHS